MSTGITVIVPTLGRDSLEGCLSSFSSQLEPQDAVVVIADGRNNDVLALVERFARVFPSPDWTYDWIEPSGCWGHPAANHALDNHVDTSHVWRLDDDDQAALDALSALRAHLDAPWAVLRMEFGPGHPASGMVCWRNRELRYGDIGTPMVFAPLTGARYGFRYAGDWDYVEQLQAGLGEPVWDEKVVALIRPAIEEEK